MPSPSNTTKRRCSGRDRGSSCRSPTTTLPQRAARPVGIANQQVVCSIRGTASSGCAAATGVAWRAGARLLRLLPRRPLGHDEDEKRDAGPGSNDGRKEDSELVAAETHR